MLCNEGMTKHAKLLWVDLEMTGLEPAKDRILEVAAIATDWNFKEFMLCSFVITLLHYIRYG